MSWDCLKWPFCPGVFIAVLAFLAAIVVFRDHPGRLWKAAWVFIFLLLMAGEVAVITHDREKQDQAQQTLLTNTQTAVTEAVEAVKNITGGDSFTVVGLTYKRDGLTIETRGHYPLTAVKADVSFDKEPQRIFTLPVLTPHLQQVLTPHRISLGEHEIDIVTNAVNGNWFEILLTKNVNGKLSTALRVMRISVTYRTPDESQVDTVSTQEIYCRVDETFPTVNGLVDWPIRIKALDKPAQVPTAPCTNR